MRLVALLLTAALAGPAQTLPGNLPWKTAPALPWQTEPGMPAAPPPAPGPNQQDRDLTVGLTPDGAVRITDAKGLIRLRAGLPGRPLRAWRDWGTPVPDWQAPLAFPSRTPLRLGPGSLPLGAVDFRQATEGLLWVLDDDESMLTVIHPATGQMAYLPLPGGQDLSLAFYPDRLVVQDGRGEDAVRWSLHWLTLLPQMLQLAKDTWSVRPRGTALAPFPRE